VPTVSFEKATEALITPWWTSETHAQKADRPQTIAKSTMLCLFRQPNFCRILSELRSTF